VVVCGGQASQFFSAILKTNLFDSFSACSRSSLMRACLLALVLYGAAWTITVRFYPCLEYTSLRKIVPYDCIGVFARCQTY